MRTHLWCAWLLALPYVVNVSTGVTFRYAVDPVVAYMEISTDDIMTVHITDKDKCVEIKPEGHGSILWIISPSWISGIKKICVEEQ